jgi:hypothetical protein
MNQALEIIEKENWELINEMRRLFTRNLSDKKPQWKWDEDHEKMIRKESKEEIDWWRYQNVILLSKLISFVKKCNQKRAETELSSMIVQEDKASTHAFKHQALIFSLHQIERLLWFENSFDLNMIESCWSWMKRRTTRKDAFTSRLIAESVWIRTWNELSQKKIQQWIERISRHIVKVIELKEGNEYCESRLDVDTRTKENKKLLTKMKESMIQLTCKSSSATSNFISENSTPRREKNLTIRLTISLTISSSFNFIRYYVISKPSTSKSLIPPSKKRALRLKKRDVFSSRKSSQRVQKVICIAVTFRSRRRWNFMLNS